MSDDDDNSDESSLFFGGSDTSGDLVQNDQSNFSELEIPSTITKPKLFKVPMLYLSFLSPNRFIERR